MTTQTKIITLQELAEKSRQCREQGERVVLCHGVFDLIHPGHVRHLQKARSFGDRLVVTITADPFVNKGPGRPIFPDTLRAESLAALDCVSWVAVNHATTALPVLHAVRPSIYVKGQDYKNPEQDISGNISLEQKAVESHGGEMCFTEEILFSSSGIINNHFEVFTQETKAYLRDFRERYRADDIIAQCQGLRDKRVLVVGEAIIDEYCTTTPMGLTGKGVNVIAARYESNELFAGGAMAVANHLAGFVDQVTLLSGVGRDDPYAPFIRAKLAPNIQTVFYEFESAPTLLKKRFIDKAMNKLFELYYYEEEPLSEAREAEACAWIAEHAGSFDLVVVPDYGNGLISARMVRALCDHARYLAVNTQVNGGNRGYHVITRYPRADFVAVNEPELRLAAHNRFDPLEGLMHTISAKVHAQQFAVTQGTAGALWLDGARNRLLHTPALSTRIVDRVGAGDSFLSLASLSLCGGIEPELALFIGSVAAALDVQIVCNRESIAPVSMFKYINTLLK
ncbi:MAG: adenylyltransferase/cytidyltransferase family protein [Magnetococcales bacterium]|nr:adenylyltransferase/cytidyltransferase family protein [Magnetococcales bacterium]